jgi:recombination protein RecR
LAESYPEALSRLISAFSRLPGIGPKTAQRLAFYLVKSPSLEVEELLSSLQEVKEKIHFCSVCGFYTEEDRCKICENPQRDRSVVCVVERPQDVLAIEKTGFRGLYHVLQGIISPLSGIGPEKIKIKELLERVSQGEIKEVILAISPSVDGEATALYLAQKLSSFPVLVTLIARGLPSGGDLEFADEVTLQEALEGRRRISLKPRKEE